MSKLYTYVVRNDTGFAPNPFWKWCTLAACTPNHQGSKVCPGDWIAGFLDKKNDYRFIYAMEVYERLHMNDYFHDARFSRKKPIVNGTARQRCGDNIYSYEKQTYWLQHKTTYHGNPRAIVQDTKHPFVFIGKRFWYLGRESAETPQNLRSLAGGRGARVNHDPKTVSAFKSWVQGNFVVGVRALPRDLLQSSAA